MKYVRPLYRALHKVKKILKNNLRPQTLSLPCSSAWHPLSLSLIYLGIISFPLYLYCSYYYFFFFCLCSVRERALLLWTPLGPIVGNTTILPPLWLQRTWICNTKKCFFNRRLHLQWQVKTHGEKMHEEERATDGEKKKARENNPTPKYIFKTNGTVTDVESSSSRPISWPSFLFFHLQSFSLFPLPLPPPPPQDPPYLNRPCVNN